MKKLLVVASIVALAGCTKYNETGLLCADAEHPSQDVAQITLDVKACSKKADVVINGEKVELSKNGADETAYYGTNAAGEQVKLMISESDNGNVDYMLGIKALTDDTDVITTYGCYKK